MVEPDPVIKSASRSLAIICSGECLDLFIFGVLAQATLSSSPSNPDMFAACVHVSLPEEAFMPSGWQGLRPAERRVALETFIATGSGFEQ